MPYIIYDLQQTVEIAIVEVGTKFIIGFASVVACFLQTLDMLPAALIEAVVALRTISTGPLQLGCHKIELPKVCFRALRKAPQHPT